MFGKSVRFIRMNIKVVVIRIQTFEVIINQNMSIENNKPEKVPAAYMRSSEK